MDPVWVFKFLTSHLVITCFLFDFATFTYVVGPALERRLVLFTLLNCYFRYKFVPPSHLGNIGNLGQNSHGIPQIFPHKRLRPDIVDAGLDEQAANANQEQSGQHISEIEIHTRTVLRQRGRNAKLKLEMNSGVTQMEANDVLMSLRPKGGDLD